MNELKTTKDEISEIVTASIASLHTKQGMRVLHFILNVISREPNSIAFIFEKDLETEHKFERGTQIEYSIPYFESDMSVEYIDVVFVVTDSLYSINKDIQLTNVEGQIFYTLESKELIKQRLLDNLWSAV
jgi:hypothetical protein